MSEHEKKAMEVSQRMRSDIVPGQRDSIDVLAEALREAEARGLERAADLLLECVQRGEVPLLQANLFYVIKFEQIIRAEAATLRREEK